LQEEEEEEEKEEEEEDMRTRVAEDCVHQAAIRNTRRTFLEVEMLQMFSIEHSGV